MSRPSPLRISITALDFVFLAHVFRQVEDQKEDMTTLQERQRDLFETIKSLEKDIQVMADYVLLCTMVQINKRRRGEPGMGRAK